MLLSIADLTALYLSHCRVKYTKFGRLTNSFGRTRVALDLLLFHLGGGRCEATDFGVRDLGAFQRWLASEPSRHWARNTISEYVACVKRMFSWAVSREIYEESACAAMERLEPLRRGQSAAAGGKPHRDGKRVTPVPAEVLRRFLESAPPMLSAMVRLQLLCAMRPCEVVAVRAKDLRKGPVEGTLEYVVTPAVNKLEHENKSRVVAIGRQGAKIVEAWSPRRGDGYLFTPKRAEEQRLQALRQTRITPIWESHTDEARSRRRRAQGVKPKMFRSHYTVAAYARSITRACQAHNIPVFSPNQVRHSGATNVCAAATLEVAREVLGHADVRTTLRYVQVGRLRAAEAMREIG